jgi:hypothetical protein
METVEAQQALLLLFSFQKGHGSSAELAVPLGKKLQVGKT